MHKCIIYYHTHICITTNIHAYTRACVCITIIVNTCIDQYLPSQAIRLTGQHDLDNPEERSRIIGCGGRVVNDSEGHTARVNARLNMTRSIGDMDLKPFGVIATPATVFYKVSVGLTCTIWLAWS